MIVLIVVKLITSIFWYKFFFIRHRLSISIDLVKQKQNYYHVSLNKFFVFFFQDLLYVQHVKSMGNRQTFHPNKLAYDVFNIEIDLGPINLLLHGLFLKKLWWVKVS